MTITIAVFEDSPAALIDPDAKPTEVWTFDSQEAAGEWLDEQSYPLVCTVDIT